MEIYKQIHKLIDELALAGVVKLHLATSSQLIIGGLNSNIINGNHVVEFIVYPVQPLFKPEDFNELLIRLIPVGKSLSCLTTFEKRYDGLKFGRLNFYENFGEIRSVVTRKVFLDNNDDILKGEEGVFEVDSDTAKLSRRIIVKMVPNKEVADILFPISESKFKEYFLALPIGLTEHGMSREYYAEFERQYGPEKKSLWKKIRKLIPV